MGNRRGRLGSSCHAGLPARQTALSFGIALAAALAGCAGTSGTKSDTSGTEAGGSNIASTTADPTIKPGATCLASRDHASTVRFGPHGALGGYLLGHGVRVVVLAHQSDGDSCQMLPLARAFAHAGYRAFAFDASGYGSSIASDVGDRTLAEDVEAAVRFARSAGARAVYLLGASMGGYGVLGAAKTIQPPVNAVVSLSAPSVYGDGGDPVNARRFPAPLLLFTGRGDLQFLSPNEAFAKQDPAATLHVLPGARHGVDLAHGAVLRQIVAFFRSHRGR